MDILQFTKTYLEVNRGTWPQIAADSGVTYTWLTKVMQGNIKNPGVLELQKVIDYIESKGGSVTAYLPYE